MFYRFFFWLVLRRLPAETAHHLSFGALRLLCAVPGVRTLLAALTRPREHVLRVSVFGRELDGPLGLAAGFDKDATGPDALGALGFGHVEIGTLTGLAQPGNPRPRLFRLPRDRALLNRMGFNNGGSAAAARRLAARAGRPLMVGANIGKTKAVPEADAVADYVFSAERVGRFADYVVVNVSSPNTPGLRDLQAVDSLRPLLTEVRAALDRVSDRRVPLLVKIAPDLADADIDAVADLALELGLDGVVATNTTVSREGLATSAGEVAEIGAGGVSGAPLKERALAVLRRLYARVGDRLVLVSVGGVETADDAYARVRAGATLIQGYTGLIYGGPGWVRKLHKGLARRLAGAGFARLSDAVGADTRRSAAGG